MIRFCYASRCRRIVAIVSLVASRAAGYRRELHHTGYRVLFFTDERTGPPVNVSTLHTPFWPVCSRGKMPLSLFLLVLLLLLRGSSFSLFLSLSFSVCSPDCCVTVHHIDVPTQLCVLTSLCAPRAPFLFLQLGGLAST
ncbi:unnamed protein product, partial [Ectocarpus sp. 13 AM-2016]